MAKADRIKECVDHHDEYVLVLAGWPDRRLREKLDTIHLQMQLAEQNRDTEALELLEIWRAQTIEARIYKAENNIEDGVDEIREAIKHIETYTADPESEQREEAHHPVKRHREVPDGNTSSEQLSFF